MPTLKKTVFRTKWFQIEEKDDFYSLVIPDSVMVLPVTDRGKVVLIKQFRPALEKNTLELPAGQVEKSEDPKDTAIRELYEETGYKPGKIIELGKDLTILANRTNASARFYLAKDCVKDPNFKPKEHIKVLEVSETKFLGLIKKGEFKQISGLAMMFLVKLNNFSI